MDYNPKVPFGPSAGLTTNANARAWPHEPASINFGRQSLEAMGRSQQFASANTLDDDNAVNVAEQVRAMLCGRIVKPNARYRQESRRLRLDPNGQQTADPDHPQAKIWFDLDSLYGFSKTIPLKVPLHVVPRYDDNDCLRGSFPIYTPFDNREADCVPHVLLGEFHPHGKVYLYFIHFPPDVLEFPAAMKPILFNRIVGPALSAVHPHPAGAELADDYKLLSGQFGKKHFTVQPNRLPILAMYIRNRSQLAGLPRELRNPCFVMTMRGTKQETRYSLPADPANHVTAHFQAIHRYVRDISDQESLHRDHYYLDRGIEYVQEGMSVQSTDIFINRVGRNLYAPCNTHEERMARNARLFELMRSQYYRRDMKAGLYDLEGGQMNLQHLQDEFSPHLAFVVYTTDKHGTYTYPPMPSMQAPEPRDLLQPTTLRKALKHTDLQIARVENILHLGDDEDEDDDDDDHANDHDNDHDHDNNNNNENDDNDEALNDPFYAPAHCPPQSRQRRIFASAVRVEVTVPLREAAQAMRGFSQSYLAVGLVVLEPQVLWSVSFYIVSMIAGYTNGF